MDRNGQLPGRCVACNAPALPRRVLRRLYWSRWEWRLFAWATPVVMMALAIAGVEAAGVLFLPAVLVLVVANSIVRKRVELEVGLCARHAGRREVLRWLCIGSVGAMFATPFAAPFLLGNPWVFLLLLGLMVGAGIAYAGSAANRLAVKRLGDRHVWLKGTGAPFRSSLPEAAPD